jgi:hypothetical protein
MELVILTAKRSSQPIRDCRGGSELPILHAPVVLSGKVGNQSADYEDRSLCERSRACTTGDGPVNESSSVQVSALSRLVSFFISWFSVEQSGRAAERLVGRIR